jgi:hypothetical protein
MTPTTWPETEKFGRSDVSVLERRLAAIFPAAGWENDLIPYPGNLFF